MGSSTDKREAYQVKQKYNTKEKEIKASIEEAIAKVRGIGAYGAKLLLLAGIESALAETLLHEAPLLRPGMTWGAVVDIVRASKPSMRGAYDSESDQDASEGAHEDADTFKHFDGYGPCLASLVIINRSHGERIRDGSLRCIEMDLDTAIVELDLESDRFEVRGWYNNIPSSSLRHEHSHLDPRVWKGLGDFR